MTLIEKTGDLFESDAEVLFNGVNCSGVMGLGLALTFKGLYPEMYKEYRLMCTENVLQPGEIYPWKDPVSGIVVMNVASQQYPGPDARLEWLESSVRKGLSYCVDRGYTRAGLPRVGCGIGGLSWDDVRSVLENLSDEFVDVEVTVYTPSQNTR